jgi:hypothetical protein
MSKEIGNVEAVRNAEENIVKIYKEQKQFEKAMVHYENFILFRDSIKNKENQRASIEKQYQYQFDRKQAADSVKNMEKINHEQIKHEQEIKQQRMYSYGGAIGFLLMLVIAALSFRGYRMKRNANIAISEQKWIIEQKQKEILDSIQYANRIQRAFMPSEKNIAKSMKRLRSKLK